MEGDGCWMRARRADKLALLKVCQGALDGASGKASCGSNRLMGHADRPVGLLGSLTIEVRVDDERSQAPVMAHQVG